MVKETLFNKLKAASIEEIRDNINYRLVLGLIIKKQGGESIDFSCPSCIWDASLKMRKLSYTNFIELITKDMSKGRIFVLKGEGVMARNFKFKNETWSNENLTDAIALDWVKRNPKAVNNLLYSKEAYNRLRAELKSGDMGPVNDWAKVSAKTTEEAPEEPKAEEATVDTAPADSATEETEEAPEEDKKKTTIPTPAGSYVGYKSRNKKPRK